MKDDAKTAAAKPCANPAQKGKPATGPVSHPADEMMTAGPCSTAGVSLLGFGAIGEDE